LEDKAGMGFDLSIVHETLAGQRFEKSYGSMF